MKKFNRVLAAAIAVPVAMGQVLAISSSAAVKPDAAQITADKLLYVNPESEIKDGKQVSDWNTRMAGYVKDVNGEYSVDAKSIVEGLSGTGKYTSLVKDIVSASANPTLTVKDGVFTVSGDADLSAYMVPQIQDKLNELGVDYTVDASILKTHYSFVVSTDLENSKEATVTGSITNDKNNTAYTVSAFDEYLNAVVADLSAQVQAAVPAADVAQFSKILGEAAANYSSYTELTKAIATKSFEETSYANADAVVAAIVDFAAKNGFESAASKPKTVDGLVAAYGSYFDKGISAVNDVLTQSDANVKLSISAADIAAVLNEGTNFKASATNGAYDLTFEIPDAEQDAVKAYVAKQNPDKEFVSFDTVKEVEVTFATTGTVSFDVTRTVTYELKDKETTTTTTSDTNTTTTTTTSGSGETTTTSGSGETTTTSGTGETTTTTSTDIIPMKDIESISVEVGEGVYNSEETSFDASELIVSAVATLKDGTTKDLDASYFGFLQTPADVYTAPYYKGTVDIYYIGDADKTALEDKPTVAVAMKGDTQLDGDVDMDDAFDTLQYYSSSAAGKTVTFTDGSDELLEKLAFYVSDIDTESKAGKKTEDAEISMDDAFNILQYVSYRAAGKDVVWSDVIGK
ncbi:hypothetical protein [Ruminococcus sp. CAG:330]|uniref:hypothetical protein n=1 Tax=Ruminococcus sp. CAG:330 TaxID=1262954 RepID=UPI00033D598C|nr:hypothetical protein [Ruminococcus sp. CAG:330]CDE11831.1 unknown [Ruminococcus sp. CAG:330]